MSPIGKPTISWQDRVIQVAKYHQANMDEAKKSNKVWSQNDTARELVRSMGRISEDLLLAEWFSKDPKVKCCSSAKEALDYVRRIKRDIHLKRFEGV